MKKINCKECVFSPFKQWSKNKVEVIRCKDCKFFSVVYSPTRPFGMSKWNWCAELGTEQMKADDFCSKGEKKDE